MKKVLFATTALAMSMTAGVAVAEIALTGDARMGMIYDGNDAQFSNRARIRFTATGETDGGLSFGATFRVDHERYNSADQRASNGTRGEVWVSGSYGKLSMGDVVSASEAAIGDLYSVGFTGGDFYANLNELHYLTGDGNNLDQGGNILYEYSINGFGLFASASDSDDNSWGAVYGANPVECGADGVCGNSDDNVSKIAWSLAANYEGTMNEWTYKVGLGYAKHDEAKEVVLGGELGYGAFKAKAFYADYKNRTDIDFRISDDTVLDFDNLNYDYDKSFGLSASYDYNQFVFKGFWVRDKGERHEAGRIAGVSKTLDMDSYGIGVDYDLGGGAVLGAGIVNTDWADDTIADMGIRFTF